VASLGTAGGRRNEGQIRSPPGQVHTHAEAEVAMPIGSPKARGKRLAWDAIGAISFPQTNDILSPNRSDP